MSTYAQTERQALSALLLEHGPDAPTLCEGWTTADLAAHLVIRERRPDAAIGIVLKPVAGHTARVQEGVRDGSPWPALVERVRTGPPFPFRLNRIDESMNTAEYFIHVEDIRRAQPGWEPRALDPGLEQALWSRVGFMARGLRKSAPVGVTVRAPGFGEVVPRTGEPHVTVTGRPGELILFLSGRQDVAQVEFDGDPAAVAELRRTKLGL
jgi:uncharacterized protein (TIGR03085 family)